ncbi:MAG: hypothetical protein PHD61_09730 [Bacteroidales bacterium]|nr:hypothetical protein [Lentimicrobiaceae bacterium]MDD5695566.1 hypothetical protein [Bacteroidales bacterium]
MKKNLLFVIAAVSMMLIFAGCAKVPQAEIDAAKAAIEEVRGAQADIYLPGEFTAINDSLRVALEKVEAQKGKLFKSYKSVKTILANIPTMAATIKANTETKKAEVKAEAEAILTAVTTMQLENNTLAAKLPMGKNEREAVEAIKAELGIIDGAITEVTNLLTNGDFMGALNKVNAIKQQAEAKNLEIKDVLTKAKIKF